ncbi:adenylate/guanylate cyclase domain-containing protein [Mesorhizobium sp. STM 4661]|uniref:adenylate/guanylate cyclase domain-containing protein n=1 Tax=Mesorhizobium sp. STM 4661 TaxID=1297570 RepID=UPI0002BE5EAF|nr:adenylate/guanylate cyclase domain-containing protein [Mesorhizobium sp. STM 4661]CCV15042.1 putative adenylate cyclase 3 [Mesorhizobium sp. STM 4661]
MPIVRAERRLAAIMAADIVAYSRLIETHEARTLSAIKALRSQVIDPLIADHRGRIVKLMGDGAIVEFGSVVEAVACAVAMQEGTAAHQREVPPESRIAFRIGINVGDVVVEDGDLLGDGVNIAARLEALAEPGSICISDAAQKQLAGKTDLAFEDAGERTLKNIAQPVRVWRWSEAPTNPAASGALLPMPDRPSIAVLPFDNLSGQPEETYFSDGVTEDIITGLSRFRSLFVVARNSSFAFRGKPTSLAEIGRQLGVAYLLEGSIRRAGERVRVTAQLLEADTGMHIWADRYDRGLEDIFAVQEEVARTIVSTLVGRIQDASLQKSLRRPPASLAAYDCLLRGLAHFRGFGEDDNRKAYEMFERAVALDPQYALAHANLVNASLALHGSAATPPEVLDAAFATASHALELDPQESSCHRVLALIWLYRRDYDAAEYHYRRALELNPNDADRLMGLGYLLALRGKLEEALGWMQEAMRLNPFQPIWYGVRLGIALYSLKRYAEAAQALKRIPTPGYWSRARLAACYGQLGRTAEAEAQKAAILLQKPDFTIAEFFRRDVLLERAEDRELLREGLIKAGLPA